MEFLLENGANVNAKNKHGHTPLHLAASSRSHRLIGSNFKNQKPNIEGMQCLLEKGADIDSKNIIGDTPIHKAAQEGLFEEVKFLISKGAFVNAKNILGRTPLHSACKNKGNLEIVKCLIENGVQIYAKDGQDRLALDYATIKGHLEIVQYLKEKTNSPKGY